MLRGGQRLGQEGEVHRLPGQDRRGRAGRPAWRTARTALKRVIQLGPNEERMCLSVFRATARKPEAADIAASLLLRYAQVRFMLDRG